MYMVKIRRPEEKDNDHNKSFAKVSAGQVHYVGKVAYGTLPRHHLRLLSKPRLDTASPSLCDVVDSLANVLCLTQSKLLFNEPIIMKPHAPTRAGRDCPFARNSAGMQAIHSAAKNRTVLRGDELTTQIITPR